MMGKLASARMFSKYVVDLLYDVLIYEATVLVQQTRSVNILISKADQSSSLSWYLAPGQSGLKSQS